MKLRTVLFLIAVLAVAAGSGDTFAQSPRPTNSIDGPLPVTIASAVQITPAPSWAGPDGSARVWVAGSAARTWSYDHVCIAGGAPAAIWSELDNKGRDGWELVGSSGVACTRDTFTGTWFLLKRSAPAK